MSSIANDWGGHLTNDRLELYFGSDRNGGTGTDMYVARRASRTDPFGTPMRLDALSTLNPDDNPFVTADGLTLFFDSNNDMYRTTRATTGDAWGVAIPIPELNSSDDDVAVGLSADGRTIYLSSSRVGTAGGLDLWMAQRASTADVFSPPVSLGGVNTGGFECCGWVAPGGTELWYTATPVLNEIWVVARDPVTGLTSGPPTVNPLFDSGDIDIDVFGTTDGEAIGFSSNRPGGFGGADLYLMERSCP